MFTDSRGPPAMLTWTPLVTFIPFFLFLIVNGEDVHNMSTTFPYSSVKSSKKNVYIYIIIYFKITILLAKYAPMCPSSERFTSPFEVDFFVLKRRPQAGLVLSTRRVFQVTKTPRYLGLMGCASQEKTLGS